MTAMFSATLGSAAASDPFTLGPGDFIAISGDGSGTVQLQVQTPSLAWVPLESWGAVTAPQAGIAMTSSGRVTRFVMARFECTSYSSGSFVCEKF